MQPIDFLLRTASACPQRIALEADDVSVTYGELARQVSALAAAFQDIDPVPGSRVAICSGNSVPHVIALMATLAAGKTWVPLNPRSAGPELARIIEFTTPSILVFDEAHREQACYTAPAGTRRLVCGTHSHEPDSVERLLAAGQGRVPRRQSRDLSEIQAIKFTGGTTGAPKGVMQSLRAWNATVVSILTAMQLRDDERYLAVASITHGTSTFLLPVFACGGTIVLASSTKPKSVLDQLESGRITATFMPPTLIYDLLDESGVAERDWSHLRHLVYAAAPMRADRIAQAIKVFGTLETSFGQTEAPAVIAYMPAADLRNPVRHGSVGRASPLTEIGIMAPDGRLLPPGEAGEIVVRGDLLMSGYWRLPEKTAETIVDGWLHTGDGGYLDPGGFLYLKDRLRDMVISGGFNVYPTDVENALGEHPAVCRCAVFGVDDPRWGEAVHAAVQLRPGTDVSSDTLRAIVRARLGPVQTPKQIHFLDNLPVTANGKVSKQALRDQLTSPDCKANFPKETLAS